MPQRIDDNGLVLTLVKLNGRLELRFTRDNTFSSQYTLHGADTDDTIDMQYAREAVAGQPVVSLGLEMFVEETPGFLEVRFDGAIGSTLTFQYDGREFGDSPTYNSSNPTNSTAAFSGFSGNMKTIYAQRPLAAPLSGDQDHQMTPNTTRDAKVQTLPPATKDVEAQTLVSSFKHAAVQTKASRKISVGIQTSDVTESISQDNDLFPAIVDLSNEEETILTAKNDTHKQTSSEPEVAQSFTNAVATVFQTFNEPRNPYRQKRQAQPAADYRAYKHLFIEGYRNGDGKEEEGRLHVDLRHHILIWESYDDYDGGAKLTLDRLDLPRCDVVHNRLKISHYFGDHQLQLYHKKSNTAFFCMDYESNETKIYGNNVGNGDERFHFVGSERVQNVLDAIQECMDHRAKYGTPRLD